MIYLDNAATTYPKPECVYEALDFANRNQAFNAGRGSYKYSKEAFQKIEEVREKIGKVVKAEPNQVVFTASATDAISDIINGIDLKEGANVYVSPFEHNAVVRSLYLIKENTNINIHTLEFDIDTWEPDLDNIKNSFAIHKPRLVVCSHISNVTGYVLPYLPIFRLAKQYDAITLLDSAQSFGALEIKKDYVDFMIFDGHKALYSSFGIGGYVNAGNISLDMVKAGGTGSDSLNVHMPAGPTGYEPGTHNVVAFYGLGQSLEWLKTVDVYEKVKELTEYLISRLTEIDGISVYMPESENIFGVVSFNVYGYEADEVGSILFEEYDICLRTGYHCAPLIHDFIRSQPYKGTVRASVGYFNTKSDIDELYDALRSL
ncbi:MAG: aminotransferase class V-fold PLP-dependent enzyme [Methanobrevibacter sp.]|nr:aminotransferase class V-fold PLP-dependent enzyme [Clostridia bacterium]MBQ6628644.1 aminotransferase class V-fold PLP-dependent enzyme [Methanobrevibacter sp.]